MIRFLTRSIFFWMLTSYSGYCAFKQIRIGSDDVEVSLALVKISPLLQKTNEEITAALMGENGAILKALSETAEAYQKAEDESIYIRFTQIINLSYLETLVSKSTFDLTSIAILAGKLGIESQRDHPLSLHRLGYFLTRKMLDQIPVWTNYREYPVDDIRLRFYAWLNEQIPDAASREFYLKFVKGYLEENSYTHFPIEQWHNPVRACEEPGVLPKWGMIERYKENDKGEFRHYYSIKDLRSGELRSLFSLARDLDVKMSCLSRRGDKLGCVATDYPSPIFHLICVSLDPKAVQTHKVKTESFSASSEVELTPELVRWEFTQDGKSFFTFVDVGGIHIRDFVHPDVDLFTVDDVIPDALELSPEAKELIFAVEEKRDGVNGFKVSCFQNIDGNYLSKGEVWLSGATPRFYFSTDQVAIQTKDGDRQLLRSSSLQGSFVLGDPVLIGEGDPLVNIVRERGVIGDCQLQSISKWVLRAFFPDRQ